MSTAKVKFNYNDGKGIEAAKEYAGKLFANGFKYSHADQNGGKVYHHSELNINVLVYVA